MVLIFTSQALMHWLHRLGGPGLILLAQVDNSPIPVPGSMDVLLIVLASSRKELWWYYALMALVGSLVASYFTYRLSKKGGKETFEKKLGESRAKKVYDVFERYGFMSLVIGAVAPPPIPMSAFLMAAGAMQYPLKKFISAVAVGRAMRYALVGYLASLYGHSLIRWMYRYYKPLLIFAIALGVVAGALAIYLWRKHAHKGDKSHKRRQMAA